MYKLVCNINPNLISAFNADLIWRLGGVTRKVGQTFLVVKQFKSNCFLRVLFFNKPMADSAPQVYILV